MKKAAAVAAASIVLLVPGVASAGDGSLSRDQARTASVDRIYAQNLCNTYPWSTCAGVSARECMRLSPAAIRCRAVWGGSRTNEMTGETTATWRCEADYTWRLARGTIKLVNESPNRCADTPSS